MNRVSVPRLAVAGGPMTRVADMRVAVVAHSHPSVSKGGAEIAAYSLFRGLRGLGVPALFVAAVAHDDAPRAEVWGPDEHLIALDPRRYDHHLELGSPAAARALVGLLQGQGVTIVNFHHYLNFGSAVLRAVKQQAGVPVVLTLHEYLAICAHHGQMVTRPARRLCAEASPDRCAACFPDAGRAGMATRRDLMLAALLAADAYVSPSRFLIDRHVQWGLPACRFEMIENGLPGPAPAQAPHQRPRDGQVIFGFFGQINPFKGVDVLLDAVDILARDPDLTGRFQVRIHGPVIGVPPAFQDRLRAAGTAHSFVQMLGPYDNRMVGQVMAETDFVVVPSTWWENSPVVIQEAYAAGRPVICSNIGGMAEKVIPGVTGLQFRAGSAGDLAATMRRAVLDFAELTFDLPAPPRDADMARQYHATFARLLAAQAEDAVATGARRGGARIARPRLAGA